MKLKLICTRQNVTRTERTVLVSEYQKVHRGDTMLTSFLSLGLKLKFQELCMQLEVEVKAPTLLI